MIYRRDFLRAGAAFLAAPTRPNVLIITTDQQFADAASYRIGTRYLRTPNLDRLAANGTVFSRAYCANPLCVPSRTAMFTGHYPVETGVMDNDAAKTRLDATKYPGIGKIFERAGYQTVYFGKWHISAAGDGFGTSETKNLDALTASKAETFLRGKHDAPFLMWASFLNPHNICEWARGQELPLGDIGNPPPVDQCPPWRPNHAPQKDEPDIVALMRKSYQSSPVFPVGDFDEKKWREYLWAYYRLIEKVDGEIGKVLRTLRETGLERNTIVVFTADHGDCQGSHGWNQKTILFEEAARVPFIVSYPGVVQKGVAPRLVNTGVDLLPTLCDYTGVELPAGMPGLSLRNSGHDPREYVVVCNRMVQGAAVNGRIPKPEGRMLRGQRFKYTVYSEGQRRESLVDLQEDPGEMVNLVGDSRLAGVLRTHRGMLREWCGKVRDSFPLVG